MQMSIALLLSGLGSTVGLTILAYAVQRVFLEEAQQATKAADQHQPLAQEQ